MLLRDSRALPGRQGRDSLSPPASPTIHGQRTVRHRAAAPVIGTRKGASRVGRWPLAALNEAASIASTAHVDTTTAEGLLNALAVDPDNLWAHVKHNAIGLSSISNFLDAVQTAVHGLPVATDSLPLNAGHSVFSECYMVPSELCNSLRAAGQQAADLPADAAHAAAAAATAAADSLHLPGLTFLSDTTAAVGPAAGLADTSQQLSSYLGDLSAWASDKLSTAQGMDPDAYEGVSTTLKEVMEALQATVDAEPQREVQQSSNGMVLAMQQLASGISLPAPVGVSSLSGMMAAQEVAGATASSVRFEDVVKVAMGVVALAIACIPSSPAPVQQQSDEQEDYQDGIPLRYDQDGLSDYFARRPLLVLQRNADMVSKLGTLACGILLDWRTGKIDANMPQRAEQLRLVSVELGPAFIKIAQAMSTRVDLLPETYLIELSKLQDNVPAFSTVKAREVMEESLGRPVDQIFDWLSEKPLAAASLGQVYRGKLREAYGGCDVAVKVQRPGVLEQVSLDIFIMRRTAVLFSMLPGMSSEWAHAMDEWAMRFFQEMDYTMEAQNTTAFRLQMQNIQGIKVAEVHPDLVSRHVIVTEWIPGEKLCESSADDVKTLCSTLLNCYLIQLLETGLLHADPHPGNLLRTPDGRIAILDFGLMTEVTEEQRILLVEFIAHLTLNDWVALSKDLEAFGFFPRGLTDDERETVLPLLEQVFMVLVNGGGLTKGFSVGNITEHLDSVARDFQMVVPPYFGLILRAFSTIEGIALRVEPDYSIVQECLPYLSRRLLTDNNPRMRTALRQMLYGDQKRINVQRLQKLMSAVGSFSTSAVPEGNPAVHNERVKGRTAEWEQDDSPLISEPMKEALRVVFSSNGSFAQELVVDEMVAAVDAMSKEAMGEALRMVVTSAGAMAAIRSMEALGPLRMMLAPVPVEVPLQVLSSMQPRVQLNDDDRQALLMFRMVLDLMQPAVSGMPMAAAGGRRVARVAGELMPLMPELLPGIQNTAELFFKAMARRMALRVAEELDPEKLQRHVYGSSITQQQQQQFKTPEGERHLPNRSGAGPSSTPTDSWDRRQSRR